MSTRPRLNQAANGAAELQGMMRDVGLHRGLVALYFHYSNKLTSMRRMRRSMLMPMDWNG